MSARKLKRAIAGSEESLPPAAEDFGATVAQAIVDGKLADVLAMGSHGLRQRNPRAGFIERWSTAIADRGGLTSFEVSNAGQIELQYIPGLEDVPQTQFVGYLEIVFASPTVPIEDEKAFAVGVVLLIEDGLLRVGAIHAR